MNGLYLSLLPAAPLSGVMTGSPPKQEKKIDLIITPPKFSVSTRNFTTERGGAIVRVWADQIILQVARLVTRYCHVSSTMCLITDRN